ncbi:MAG: DUF4159 domain-containing protein [Candidatus Latescibacteria bacterium]|nr:DUF4159 domain-containing protein [Candidatus Latescibacterota bacterium]
MPVPTLRPAQKTLWGSLLISVLLHLAGIGLIEYVWWGAGDERLVKVRLVQPPRMRPVRLEVVPVAGGQAEPLTRMERLNAEPAVPHYLNEAQSALAGELAGGAGQGMPGGQEGPPRSPDGGPLAFGGSGPGARGPGAYAAPGERGPALGGLAKPGTGREADRSFDLLRIQDMARANKDHAAVIPNWASRRDLKGYVNITRVKGVGFASGIVEELARYMTDYTQVLVQAQPGFYEYFLNEQLLKDPAHFFFHGGFKPPTPYPLTQMSREEIELLGRYLRGGGFVFIEGGRNFLNEMITYLKEALQGKGRLYPLPLSHPIYTAYYDFSGGFPGEDKRHDKWLDIEWADPWYFPESPVLDLEPDGTGIQLAPTPVNAQPQAQSQPQPKPLGLWGVELDGKVVVVLSDLGIHNKWIDNSDPDNPSEEFVGYNLMAGTNVLVYALTRQGGNTPQLPPPAWEQVKPQAPLAERPGVEVGGESSELLDELDASLALVQTPLGQVLEAGGVQVIVDGKYSLELLKGGLNGFILHNLPPGAHWLELRYAGKSRQLDVELKGGQVRTLTFGLNRLGFLTQLRLSQQEELMGEEAWRTNFGDLQIEEVFLGEDREKLE